MIAFTDATLIVMVEDDDGHARLIEKNIRRAGVVNRILHLRNGHEGLSFLRGAIGMREPLLVLLDLNLPDMAGTEILQWLRADSRLRRTPVIILTTTDDKIEVERCYDLGCNVYMTKPLVYQKFAGMMRLLGSFLPAIEVPEPA